MKLKKKRFFEIIASINEIEDQQKLNNLLLFFADREKSIKKEMYATTFLMILSIAYLFALNEESSPLKLNLVILTLNKGVYADSVAILLLGFLNFRYVMISKNRSMVHRVINTLTEKLYPELGKNSYKTYMAAFVPINELQIEENRGGLYVFFMLLLMIPLLMMLITPVLVQVRFSYIYFLESEDFTFPLVYAHALSVYFFLLMVNGIIAMAKRNSELVQ